MREGFVMVAPARKSLFSYLFKNGKENGYRASGRPFRLTAAQGAASAVVLAAGLLVAAGGSGTALAGSGPAPVCADGTCTVTYSSPGTGQSFTVPAGVTSLAVTLYGGVGGSATVGPPAATDPNTGQFDSAPGGDGAEITANMPVTSGTTLGVDVGGAGAAGSASGAAGGANGGGSVTAPPNEPPSGFSPGAFTSGGGGGGGTDLTTAPSGGTPLLDAGGGGGAGLPALYFVGEADFDYYYPCMYPPPDPISGTGGDADTTGATGFMWPSPNNVGDYDGGGGGNPGTLSGAGAGGAAGQATGDAGPDCLNTYGGVPPSAYGAGTAGTAGSGSTGGAGAGYGGGGGGGYAGGGGGGSGAWVEICGVYGSAPMPIPCGYNQSSGGGGGGGGSYLGGVSGASLSDTGNSGQINGGDGEVVLSYADPISTGSPVYSTTAGQTLTVPAGSGLLSASGAGTSIPSGDTATASGPASGQTAQGGSVTVNSDGSFSYTPPPGFAGLDSFGYTVTDAAGDYITGTVSLQALFISQTITFTSSPPGQPEPGGTYAPTATGGGSGQPVVFSIDPASTSVCSIGGGTVTFTAPGTCIIDANQAGRGVYAPATQVSQPVTVQLIPQTITFGSSPPSPAVVGSTYTPAATGGGSGQPVMFSIDPASPLVCSISGGTVTFTAPGTCTIDANQTGGGQYASAPQVTQSVTVDLAPTFVLATPHLSAGAGQTYGYTFAASGSPAPTYALAKAPSWLTIDASDGAVSGTPPAGTKAFSYSVTATNAIGMATAGPFRVTVPKTVPTQDLGVKLTCPASVTVGRTGACTVAVTNHAATAAPLVGVAVVLPTILAGSSCTGGCTMTGNVAVWHLAKLGAGMTKKFTITTAATSAGSGELLAAVDAASLDPNLANNLAVAPMAATP
jgi:hypothetical protein